MVLLTEKPPLTPEWLERCALRAGDDHLAQAEQCDPEVNPHAAAFFITRFCKTLDEERPAEIRPIEPWPFVLDLIDFYEGLRTDPANGLVDKSRRMLGTWTAVAWFLWRSQWIKGFPAFMTSGKGGDYVDDGGDHSTPKSLFGRFRFMWDRVPDHLKRETTFAFKRIVCPSTDAYISGEAPTEQGGRAGGYAAALVDEIAFAPFGEALNTALDPACRLGRLYVTTPNGPGTVHARIVKTRPKGWRIHTLDWTEHPLLNQGLEDTPEHELDRYGPKVSMRFREITASLRDDDVAQEYGHSLERSLKGLVIKEFQIRRHVAQDAIRYDPDFPIVIGVDYGSTGWGAAVGGQKVGDWSLRCLFDYELEGAGDVATHAKNLTDIIRSIGFTGPLSDVLLVGGPDTDITQTGSGQTVAGYYRASGFLRIRQSRLAGPGSVDRGITVVCTSFRKDRILISPHCRHLVGRFGEYRWPVERGTGIVRATKPVHNEASHIMDAFRYLVTDSFSDELVDRVPKGRPLRTDVERGRDVLHPREGVDRPLMVYPSRF